MCYCQQAGEASVARSATRGVMALLLLHCLLSECGALIHLAMTDHDSAQGRILLMQGVFTRFPTLLADALYTIQMTTGDPLSIISVLMLKALTEFQLGDLADRGKEFDGRQTSDMLHRLCKALPEHLICSSTKRLWDARQPLRTATSFFCSLRLA